ncbi:MAG: LysR family transcriptional regulator [Polyangiaceae bacterium]
MIDWDDLRVFLAVGRRGTLAKAASALGINATTVGRRLEKLEETAGARLFDRTPDGYALTSAGRDLLPRAERMEAEALALERAVRGADQREAGTVRLSVTEMLGTRFIAPHLPPPSGAGTWRSSSIRRARAARCPRPPRADASRARSLAKTTWSSSG